MFLTTEEGIEVYKNAVRSYLAWYKIHAEHINVSDGLLDPNLIKLVKWKSEIRGMSQALGMKKKEKRELDLKLELEFKEFSKEEKSS